MRDAMLRRILRQAAGPSSREHIPMHIVARIAILAVVMFATPVFAMAFMVHMHKKLAGSPAALVARPR